MSCTALYSTASSQDPSRLRPYPSSVLHVVGFTFCVPAYLCSLCRSPLSCRTFRDRLQWFRLPIPSVRDPPGVPVVRGRRAPSFTLRSLIMSCCGVVSALPAPLAYPLITTHVPSIAMHLSSSPSRSHTASPRNSPARWS